MKRLIRSIMLAIVTAIVLISCQTATSMPQPVTIKLSGWGASPTEQTLMQQLLQGFEQTHPQIKVRYEVINDQYMDVIKTRLIGDAAPDLFYLDVFEAPFLIGQNVLEPLDGLRPGFAHRYIPPDFDTADFEPALLNAFQYQGKTYGFPKDYSTLALFYNKKAFAQAGLTQPPQTWEDLREYSKRLTIDPNQDGKIDQYGFGVIPEVARQVPNIQAYGGRLVDGNEAAFASDEAVKGLQLVVDQYRIDRTSAQKSDVGTNSGSEMFGQGKVAMAIEGNWAIPYLKETFPDLDFGTAELPRINGKPGTMIYTVAYVMNRQSQHKAQAAELIAYLTGKAGMEKWTGTGFALPTRKSVAAKLGYDRDPLRSALVAGVSYGTPWQAGEYPSVIMNNFDNQFISALLGEQSLKSAMQKAQNDANTQIRSAE